MRRNLLGTRYHVGKRLHTYLVQERLFGLFPSHVRLVYVRTKYLLRVFKANLNQVPQYVLRVF